MTLEELEAECARREGIDMDPDAEPGFSVVLARPASGYLRMRVAPGLMGELLTENADGKAVVRVKCKDVRRFLARATTKTEGT